MLSLPTDHQVSTPSHIIASGSSPLAAESSSLAFDGESSTLYWSAPGGVYRMKLGGGQSQQVFVKRGDGIDFVKGRLLTAATHGLERGCPSLNDKDVLEGLVTGQCNVVCKRR